MEKYKLGIYDITIAAQYMESFQDFQNLEMATKKAYGIMDKYHYNPIVLTKEIRPYFGHVETLHIYNKGDEEFKDEEFYKIIYSEKHGWMHGYIIPHKTTYKNKKELFMYKVPVDSIESITHIDFFRGVVGEDFLEQ